MDYLKKLQGQTAWIIFLGFFISNAVLVGLWFVSAYFADMPTTTLAVIYIGVLILFNWSLADFLATRLTNPIKTLRQAVLHVSKEASNVGPPGLDHVYMGRELLASLVPQIYQLASGVEKVSGATTPAVASNTVLDTLPLPVVVINNEQAIGYLNPVAAEFFGVNANEITGKNVHESLRLSFTTDDTLENWFAQSRKRRITATKTWQRVRITDSEGKTTRQGDMVAYYNKGLGPALEASLVFYDRSPEYASDDQSISFVALAVHELRTPLTVMRGYIEVFDEELADKLDEEQLSFMRRLSASAQQLTAFISNILNVARIEENQLVLHLEEQKWPDIIHASIKDMAMRADVNGKRIDLNVHTGLPTVAADRMSIYEVICNLLDNAIKYSGKSQRIVVSARQIKDGSIETTVQDFGQGIDASVLPHIFDKFYRNHRSREHVGGTGLGLYLCKAIVEAHGGHIWVRSKEGEGSTFGFTVQNYKDVASSDQSIDNKGGITRSAHGWIKNHSLYRD